MLPAVSILLQSESFSDVWPKLATSAGATLRLGEKVAEMEPLAESCCVVVAAGGVADRVGHVLPTLSAAGAPPVAVVGISTDHRLACSLLRAGADNYFALPGDLDLLREWLMQQVARRQEEARARALAEASREQHGFAQLIGRSAALRSVLERAGKVVRHGTGTLLITGETGTGKELLAQAIHYNGPRASQPFVAINCAAIPASLVEAELFGHEKGAFTDAHLARPGLFEMAHGGTLFLDEVGDLPLGLQAKLLRVLEERRVRRLGSPQDVAVDVRLIAATHTDLAAAVEEGRFRRDLYFRLNVIPLHLPPLRDRGEDILLLVEQFAAQFSRNYGAARPVLTAGTRRALLAYAWPGNIRELKNLVERAVLLGEDILPSGEETPHSGNGSNASGICVLLTMDSMQRKTAKDTLKRMGGNKSQAAKVLGISRKRLYALLSCEPATPVAAD
ncbi:MAG: sigma-54-dependent Fis family transcriptional regulator [Gemmatimonadetes bacterium]|nr:sigma-54-dependent Fis family transcriptional regulator [Gemmatimonadota bacterium]